MYVLRNIRSALGRILLLTSVNIWGLPWLGIPRLLAILISGYHTILLFKRSRVRFQLLRYRTREDSKTEGSRVLAGSAPYTEDRQLPEFEL